MSDELDTEGRGVLRMGKTLLNCVKGHAKRRSHLERAGLAR
jgi:hypothetical protein